MSVLDLLHPVCSCTDWSRVRRVWSYHRRRWARVETLRSGIFLGRHVRWAFAILLAIGHFFRSLRCKILVTLFRQRHARGAGALWRLLYDCDVVGVGFGGVYKNFVLAIGFVRHGPFCRRVATKMFARRRVRRTKPRWAHISLPWRPGIVVQQNWLLRPARQG